MGILTILGFLVGRRQAILDIAASRHAIWLGLLFVLSAGFAREYDGEDLLHEPWHLFIPLAASLVTSTILYCVLWVVMRGWKTFPDEWGTFRAFVALYWMTAPLAWIYAIPVERFLSPVDATAANFWFLGVIAAWRVLLIIRVVSVLFHAPVIQTAFPVLFFADTVLLTLLRFMPRPIVPLMGGVRLTQAEAMIADVTCTTAALGLLIWPILALGTLIVIFAYGRRERAPALNHSSVGPIQTSAWSLAILSLIIWLPILPSTQLEQQRRREAEQLMRAGKIEESLAFMAQFEASDFPPHWDPPPRIAYREKPGSELLDVLDVLVQQAGIPGWLKKEYLRKYDYHFHDYPDFWNEMSNEEFERHLKWMERIPPSDASPVWSSDYMRGALESGNRLTNRTAEQRRRLGKLLKLDAQAPELDANSGSSTPGNEE